MEINSQLLGCIIVLWGWDERQTKSRNKQRDKDNKIYLSWALTNTQEQIMGGTNTQVGGTTKFSKKVWETKCGNEGNDKDMTWK